MIKCMIITSWTFVEPQNPEREQGKFRPTVIIDHPLTGGCKWSDKTNQPFVNLTPSPNSYIIRAIITEAIRDAIEADPSYFILSEEVV